MSIHDIVHTFQQSEWLARKYWRIKISTIISRTTVKHTHTHTHTHVETTSLQQLSSQLHPILLHTSVYSISNIPWYKVYFVNLATTNKTRLPALLTLSTPAVPNCCCSKGSAPYWSNTPFLIFDIRALWRSRLSARVPKCQKSKMAG